MKKEGKIKIKRKNFELKLKRSLIVFLIFFVIFLIFFVFQMNSQIEKQSLIDYSHNEIPTPLELDIKKMVKGYPMEEMVPYIAKFDRQTAAFIVSIAKKESNWGKRTPKMSGKECYNYWGFQGGEVQNQAGFGCFASPQEAVEAVGNRINELVYEYNRNTPEKMIVWKCGYNCSGHSAFGVRKWIWDVNLYFRKFFE